MGAVPSIEQLHLCIGAQPFEGGGPAPSIIQRVSHALGADGRYVCVCVCVRERERERVCEGVVRWIVLDLWNVEGIMHNTAWGCLFPWGWNEASTHGPNSAHLQHQCRAPIHGSYQVVERTWGREVKHAPAHHLKACQRPTHRLAAPSGSLFLPDPAQHPTLLSPENSQGPGVAGCPPYLPSQPLVCQIRPAGIQALQLLLDAALEEGKERLRG